MNHIAILFVVAAATAVPAYAQSFPGQTLQLPTRAQQLGVGVSDSTPINTNDFLTLNAVGTDDRGNLLIKGTGAIPLSAFAGAADVAALQDRQGDLTFDLRRVERKAARGTALASASDLQGPAPGKSSRIGGMVSTYDGKTAGAVSFTHRTGQVDVGAAVAFSGGDQLGKAGAGFSF